VGVKGGWGGKKRMMVTQQERHYSNQLADSKPNQCTTKVLEQRQRQRLKETDSTIAKRLAWSKAQCARAVAGGGGSGSTGEGGTTGGSGTVGSGAKGASSSAALAAVGSSSNAYDHLVMNVDDRGQVRGWWGLGLGWL